MNRIDKNNRYTSLHNVNMIFGSHLAVLVELALVDLTNGIPLIHP